MERGSAGSGKIGAAPPKGEMATELMLSPVP